MPSSRSHPTHVRPELACTATQRVGRPPSRVRPPRTISGPRPSRFGARGRGVYAGQQVAVAASVPHPYPSARARARGGLLACRHESRTVARIRNHAGARACACVPWQEGRTDDPYVPPSLRFLFHESRGRRGPLSDYDYVLPWADGPRPRSPSALSSAGLPSHRVTRWTRRFVCVPTVCLPAPLPAVANARPWPWNGVVVATGSLFACPCERHAGPLLICTKTKFGLWAIQSGLAPLTICGHTLRLL